MGNAGSIEVKKKGAFLQIKSEDGVLKRVDRQSGDRIPIKQLFVKIEDITSISEKLDDNDCIMTLRNGVEYCLDELEEPDDVYDAVKEKMMQDEDDE
mmetsp:Transcript_72420/g.187911  ORF Transcript_72420/g.187911 Transcript_72420/m.187911 type:complete len:97 (+) Transcript_72420:63-353(+)